MVNKYNPFKSAQYLKILSKNVRRTYLMVKNKSHKIKSLWDNKMIIDADYADNSENEGEIYLQLINLAPFDIKLQKGDCIGQGIIKPYFITANDRAEGERVGGFGSTEKGI